VTGRWRREEAALGGWWRLEEAAEPVTSRAIDLSWVVDWHCTDVDDGGWWLGGGVEAAARRLDRTGVEATGWLGHGGAQGGTGYRGGGGVEEPTTPGCSWTGAWRTVGA
jgi:hypothetical protein